MTADVLAYTCRARYSGPYECGAGEHWVTIIVMGLFGLVGIVCLVGMALLWMTDLKRPWRHQARAEELRQRGLERLDSARRARERAERPAEDHSPFRRPPGNQPW